MMRTNPLLLDGRPIIPPLALLSSTYLRFHGTIRAPNVLWVDFPWAPPWLLFQWILHGFSSFSYSIPDRLLLGSAAFYIFVSPPG